VPTVPFGSAEAVVKTSGANTVTLTVPVVMPPVPYAV
jgi:hypothetical protein